MSAPGLDLEALHCLLWARSASDNSIRVVQTKFCSELGASRYSLNRALQALVAGGHLERITRPGSGIHQLYVVVDPQETGPPVDPAAMP